MVYSGIFNSSSASLTCGIEKRSPSRLFSNSPISVKPSPRLYRTEKQTHLINLPRLHYSRLCHQKKFLAFGSSNSEYTEFDKFLVKYHLNYRSCLVFVTALILGFYAGVVLTKRNARILSSSSISEPVETCTDFDLPDESVSENSSLPESEEEFIWWLEPSGIIIIGGVLIYLSMAFVD